MRGGAAGGDAGGAAGGASVGSDRLIQWECPVCKGSTNRNPCDLERPKKIQYYEGGGKWIEVIRDMPCGYDNPNAPLERTYNPLLDNWDKI